ncbi:glutamine synthetase family protein [Leptolyngbya sp. FACHB-261]|uniref:glutamine synthetase family protein n=1 Tax=Leptolyngbya sp. FACHB-261 TaxID=2692806 RepID=UPI0016883F40|nr:glutamine synthetase family protein [Leptolyngbya sp. FACHB-261]MBD2103518.1 glutamine synthetase [Leptolyngbya sp. FACHB-261]
MVSDVLEALGKANTRFIRVLWCDNANIIRAKAIHIGALSRHPDGVSISVAQQALPALYDAVVSGSGLGPVGEVQLVPDWETLMPLPYAPSHARVFGDMVKDQRPWSLCPRHFLKRMIAEAEQQGGFQVMAAFENEFYLLKSNSDGPLPADETVFASTLAMDLHQPVIDDITEALLAQGMQVEQYYPESGPGQQEISILYSHALQAADQQIAFRETVRAVALRHNLRASFLPKIFADKAGSGCHLHLSLWRNGQNLLPSPGSVGGLSAVARAFIAGILQHLPALMALTTPSPNSYRRIRPHFWSGAFCCWGLDNREAAVRVPGGPGGSGSTHFELKTADATANPYLALGAVIAAGLDGIRRNLNPGEPVTVDPGHLSPEQRQAQQIAPLPTNLGEAIEHLRQDEVLQGALEPGLAQAYLAVRQAEWQALKGLELPEEVKLLLERY